MSEVKFLDLTRQYRAIEAELEEAILKVARSGQYILGPTVQAFERQAADYLQVKRTVACASGSDALLLSLMALGIGPGDEVITSTYTFFATAGSIERLGARPVFVDIEPDSFNLNPDEVANRVTERTKAIVPVHLFGQCARMEAIVAIGDRHNLKVVEDACQAFGAARHGRKAGSFGETGCFSFFPTKNLGAFGDGGLIATDSEELAERLLILRDHGQKPRYHHGLVGINSRLDALQAAILSVKLPYVDKWIENRREHASYYNEQLKNVDVKVPVEEEGNFHAFNQYVIRVRDRGRLLERFERAKVGFALYYPVPLHLQECFRDLGYREGDFPESEALAKESLALPIYPEMTQDEQDAVIGEIKEHFDARTEKLADSETRGFVKAGRKRPSRTAR